MMHRADPVARYHWSFSRFLKPSIGVFKLSFRPVRLPVVPGALTGTDGVAVLGGSIKKPYELCADLGLAFSRRSDLFTETLASGAGEELVHSCALWGDG